MICRSCGNELSDNTTVCPFCETVTSTHKQKSKRNFRIFMAVSAAVIILATVITCIVTNN